MTVCVAHLLGQYNFRFYARHFNSKLQKEHNGNDTAAATRSAGYKRVATPHWLLPTAGNGSSNWTHNSTNETNILAGIFALHSRRNCFFPSSTMQTKRSFSLARRADTLHYLLMYGTYHQLLHTQLHISGPAPIPIGIRSDATRGYCNCGHNLSKLSDDI